jgi:uncharacterized Zn-finger protein
VFDESSQMFKCNYNECNLQFNRFSKLLIHRNRHYGQKSFKCSADYPDCKWSFFTIGELKNHQLWSHSSEKPFKCDWKGCEQQFKLRNHLGIYQIFFNATFYSNCAIIIFIWIIWLIELHKLLHSGEMPFRCEWPGCQMKFLRKTALKVHSSSHLGLKTFGCDWPECGHMFRLFIYFICYFHYIFF